jgi:hypothetical protein
MLDLAAIERDSRNLESFAMQRPASRGDDFV